MEPEPEEEAPSTSVPSASHGDYGALVCGQGHWYQVITAYGATMPLCFRLSHTQLTGPVFSHLLPHQQVKSGYQSIQKKVDALFTISFTTGPYGMRGCPHPDKC